MAKRQSIAALIAALNDGDISLVVADPTIIAVAKRDCDGIVPLYYNMSKAPAEPLTYQAMYNGMMAAWTGGNIGEVSNKITKIWNTPEPDLEAIKQLCCLNNFTIDFAKTRVKYLPPPPIEAKIARLTSSKLPHFFLYAKDKENKQVAEAGNGCVDRLGRLIHRYKFDFKAKQLGEFDYKLMMDDPNYKPAKSDALLLKTYYELAATTNCRIITDNEGNNNYDLVFSNIREELLKIDADAAHVVDVLVKQLFNVKRSKHKTVFWNCFGKEVLENLQRNVPANTVMCHDCGKRFTKNSPRQELCDKCARKHAKEKYKRYNKKRAEKQLPFKKSLEPA